MSDNFVAATLLSLVAGCIGWAIFFLWPMVSRAQFVREISEIRDDADDAIIYGDLPDAAATRDFLDKADAYLARPKTVSISLMVAIHFALRAHGRSTDPEPMSYAELTPVQRRLMHELDQRMIESLARYVRRGSRLFVVFWCVTRAVGFGGKVTTSFRRKVPAPRATQLATEFNRFDHRPLTHAR